MRKSALHKRWRPARLFIVPVIALGLLPPMTTSANANLLDNLFSVFEPGDDQKIGAEQHERVVAQYGGEYIQEGLNEYILDIGLRLAFVSEMRDLPWRFTILNSPVVNAFALPGG